MKNSLSKGRPFFDMVGKKYGKWTVIERDNSKNGMKQLYWICKCDCGSERSVSGSNLRVSGSKQCILCFRNDLSEKMKKCFKLCKH